MDPARQQELADLLRSRRERLEPEKARFPNGSQRIPGLRREEVASLAGVSPAYLAYLEQARPVRPSAEVLDGLASALRFTAAEREHLFLLAHGFAPLACSDAAEQIDPGAARLLEMLSDHPAYVTGRCWDILACNRPAAALFGNWASHDGTRVNLLRWMFCTSHAQQVLVEWEAEARALMARFRQSAGAGPHDPDVRALTGELTAASERFAAWWTSHEFLPRQAGIKRLRHPRAGEMTLRHTVLHVGTAPEQKLVVYYADPGSADEQRLKRTLTEPPAHR
jgi:transcriptional regulator with XRE-family HTH domain